MVDDVRCNLNVPVKALQRVVCRRIAEPLLDVCHVPDSGAEGLRQAVDRRGQRRHLVRQRRADVRRHHVCAHAGFKRFADVVEFPPQHLFHAAVEPRLLPGKQIRVFVQLRHKV